MDQISELCRLCVGEITENPKSLFDSHIEGSPVVDVVRKFCFKITVLKDDKLSKYICENCYNILHNAHDLCERSVQSERELHLMLSDVVIKQEQIDFDDDDYENMKIMDHDISLVKPDIELIEGTNELDEEDVKQDIKPKRVKKHQCKTCLKMFEKPSKLARHEKTHDVNRRPFACDDCFQRFQTAESLERHKIIHSGMTLKIGPDIKEWPCIMCGKVFDTQTTMASHMRIHKDEMEKLEFPCNLCDRVFQKLNELTRHSRTHAENKNYKCQICSKMFSQGSHLIDHLNRHNNVRPHVCHVCNKAFQQSSTLKDHLRTHSQEKPFLCSTCGKSFNNPSNLRQHVKRHMNLKEFECHLCPGKFSCKASLQSHIRSHEGIKSHTCQICGSSFTKGSSLKKHVRTIHEGIKEHPCSTCSMRFSSAEHLKRHFRTHSGEKPYKCDQPGCDKAYAQSNDLLKHRKFHLGGENVYKCTYENCDGSFRLKSLLRDHYAVHKQAFIPEEEEEEIPLE